MPKRILSIESFAAGVLSDADQEDVPVEAAVYSENIDPEAPAGMVRGVRGDSLHLDATLAGEELLKAGTITIDGTDWTVLLTKPGATCKIYVYDGSTISDVTGGLTINYSADHEMVVLDKAAFVGIGGSVYWVGNLEGRKQFSGSGTPITLSGWHAEKLDHDWSEGLSAANITASNPLATRGDVKTYTLTREGGTEEEQHQVNLSVEPEGQELAGIEKVFFAVSPVYDGYVNGPLDAIGNVAVSGTNTFKMEKDLDAEIGPGDWYYTGSGKRVFTTINGTDQYDVLAAYSDELPVVNSEVDFQVSIDSSALSSRVTALDLYAATSSDPNASDAETSYRFVRQIHLNDDGWSGGSTYQIWANISLLNLEGPTFDEHAGLSEEITDPRIDWRLATAQKNHLFATRSDSPTGASDENWSSFLVRSKSYQYGIFDWSKDFLVLPIEPKALASYGGRIYAFGANEFVRINPDTLEVEDRFRGAGAHHHRAVISTQRGLFFANHENCFHFDGATLRTIGDPIRRMDYAEGEGWAEAFSTSKATVVSPDGDLILFARAPTSGNTKYFVWDARRGIWHIVVSDFATLRGAYTQEGAAYISGESGGTYHTYRIFDPGASRRSWAWVSQQLAMGQPQGRHKVYEVRVAGDVLTARLAQDAEALSGTAELPAPTSENGYRRYALGSYVQGSRTQLRLEGSSSDELRGASIVYRLLRTP